MWCDFTCIPNRNYYLNIWRQLFILNKISLIENNSFISLCKRTQVFCHDEELCDANWISRPTGLDKKLILFQTLYHQIDILNCKFAFKWDDRRILWDWYRDGGVVVVDEVVKARQENNRINFFMLVFLDSNFWINCICQIIFSLDNYSFFYICLSRLFCCCLIRVAISLFVVPASIWVFWMRVWSLRCIVYMVLPREMSRRILFFQPWILKL